MRRNLAVVLGVGVGLAAFGLLRRQLGRARRPRPLSPTGGSARLAAEELRRKLAESRSESLPDRPREDSTVPGEGIDDELARARAAVHREAYATLDEMRRAGL